MAYNHGVDEDDPDASWPGVVEYQPAYMLNSLRTRRYIEAERPAPDSKSVEARLLSQRALLEGVMDYDLVLAEAVLHWNVGGREVMIPQIEHLIAVRSLPNVRLGIIPLRTRLDFFAGHAFHIYDGKSVVVGTLTERRTFHDEVNVSRYRAKFGQVSLAASYGERCRSILDDVLEKYRRELG